MNIYLIIIVLWHTLSLGMSMNNSKKGGEVVVSILAYALVMWLLYMAFITK